MNYPSIIGNHAIQITKFVIVLYKKETIVKETDNKKKARVLDAIYTI
jgi:hypothetical protein